MSAIELEVLNDEGATEEIALTPSSSEDKADILKNHQDLSWKSFFSEYYSLVRYNHQFRYLWLSTVVSLVGDWLNEIGCITILNEMTDSGTLVSLFMVSRELPALLWNPVVGVVADSFDRNKILIISDIVRSVVVLFFLLVKPTKSIWLLYILAFSQFSVTSFFNPAMESMVPGVVSAKELLAANSLLGLTWSGMLMLGAALGGAITFSLGTTADFIADSLSYLLSAVLLLRLLSLKRSQKGFSKLTEEEEDVDTSEQKKEEPEPEVGAWQKYKDGVKFLWKNKYYLCMASAKGSGSFVWSVIEVVIIKVSSTYYKIGSDSSLSLSILYLTTGIGVCIGPLFTKKLFRDNEHNNRWLLVYGYFWICVGTLAMAIPMTFPLFAVVNFFRATGSSTVWVYSSVILQRGVPDQMLGRVFAFEFAVATIMSVTARLSFGLLYDKWGVSPIQITLIYGIIAGIVLILWFIGILWITRKERNSAKNIVFEETETVPIE